MRNRRKNYPLYTVTPFQSIRELLQIAVSEAGDKPAFRFKEGKDVRTVSYREFVQDTMYLGTALLSLGVESSHVAVIGENSYPWITVFLTMLQSRGVFVPIDKELPYADIVHVLKHSDSEVLFFSKKYEKYLPRFLEDLPNIKYFIGFGSPETGDRVRSFDAVLNLGRDVAAAGETGFSEITVDPTALKEIVYTSGTTGMAKGVMLTEENLVNIVYHGLRNTDVKTVCLSVLPMHHTYEAAGLLFSLHRHACICINENMKAVLLNLQLYKPDYIYLVPAFLELFYKKIWATAKENGRERLLKIMLSLSKFLRFFGIDIRRRLFRSIHATFGGNLSQIVSGGAPLRYELATFFDDIGLTVVNGYGITECSPLISANRNEFNDPATVGVPLPGIEVKIQNPTEEGDGEICVKGKNVMLGYYKDEARTREVLKDGWFYTGDYGRFNQKGQLMITGRKKNLIVLKNGKNIFPEELEALIMEIPYVEEVIVSGIKDESGAETGLMAEVFLSRDVEAMTEDPEETLRVDIRRIFSDLPIYKQITKIKIRDTEFAKTTTNKIKR